MLREASSHSRHGLVNAWDDQEQQLVASPTNRPERGDERSLIAGENKSVLGECIVCRHYIHDLSRGTYFFHFSCGHETHEKCWPNADKAESLVCPTCNSEVDNVSMDYIWHSMKDDESDRISHATPQQERIDREQISDDEESEIQNLNSTFAAKTKVESSPED